MKKIVLAYSGGLDTTYCLKYLQEELGAEVHTALVNTGGFSEEELESTSKKAIKMGASSHQTLEITDKYYEKAIKYMVFGNVLKNQTYPLSVSSERVFQALALIEFALQIKADAIAHGSTGAGNDQVRFDMIFQTMAPHLEIITPIRDQHLSRQEEIAYLGRHGVHLDWEKAQYSINQGLWGTSVGGKETLTSHQALPDHAYPSQLASEDPMHISLQFKKGELCGINDEELESIEAIRKLEKLATHYAIGRDIHVGDTIIGMKGRVGFEAASPLIIIKAHHHLEKHVLTKWQQYWKDQLGAWYGMMLHEGNYLDPVMRNIEAFMDDSQKTVSGKVFVKLMPYTFHIEGIDSKHDLMKNEFGEYGEKNTLFSAEDAKGFIKVMSTQGKIFNAVNPDYHKK